MEDRKTLNEWARELGYQWVADEELYKGAMTEAEAERLLRRKCAEGKMRYDG